MQLKQNHSKVPSLRLCFCAPLASLCAQNMNDYETAIGFLGEWGPFQQQVFFLLCVSIVPNGFVSLSIVFLADTPAHHCLVPAHLNLSAAWRNSSIPLEEQVEGEESRMPSKCSRYKLEDMLRFSDRGLLPGVDVNLSDVATEGCLDGWEYDRSVYTSTIISEVCARSEEAAAGGGHAASQDDGLLLI